MVTQNDDFAKQAGCAGCGILLLVILIGLGWAWHQDETIQQAPYDSASSISVTSGQIDQEFHDNEIAAAAKYGNKSILINGIVTEISDGDSDHADIKLEGSEDLSEVMAILKSKNDALKFTKGDQISLKCVGARKSLGDTVLDACAI